MNILLINPSLISSEIQHYSNQLEKGRGIYPSLGLSYIASSLKHAGHNITIIDCDAEKNSSDRIKEVILHDRPALVGFYVMTWTFRQVLRLLKQIKDLNSDILSVAGGPNVTSFPKVTLEYSNLDFAIHGEGEDAIVELITCLESHGDLSRIDGLVWRNDGRIIVNQQRKLKSNLDEIYFPNWQALPVNNYHDVFTQHRHFATMIATRGCPFNCTFCDRKNRMGRHWRSRSPENIVEEIKYHVETFKISEFMFFDDNFVTNRDWVFKFCNELLSRKLNIVWECRTRVDTVDSPLLRTMRKSGCYRIRYGMEAGDDRILRVLKKDITVQQIRECSRITKNEGIEIFAYFMMGSPHETEDTLKKTLNLALEIDADFTLFSKTIFIAGSELFDWAVENGFIDSEYWIRYLIGKETNPAPSLSTDELPEHRVDYYISLANKKFYLRPHFIAKRLSKIRSFEQFRRQANMATAFLK